mgnify:CR=1 FL=1
MLVTFVTGAPATVTNVMADFQNEYVWHCHILGHEENDFMRPFVFNAKELPPPAFSADAGVLAGYPMVDVKVILQDGAFHPYQAGVVYRKAAHWLCVAASGGWLADTAAR